MEEAPDCGTSQVTMDKTYVHESFIVGAWSTQKERKKPFIQQYHTRGRILKENIHF
jgi:hypothetical protein